MVYDLSVIPSLMGLAGRWADGRRADFGYYYCNKDIILCTYIQNFQIITIFIKTIIWNKNELFILKIITQLRTSTLLV